MRVRNTATCLLTITLALLAGPALADPINWHTRYFKDEVPLTLDEYRVAILNPSATLVSAKIRELRAQHEAALHHKDGLISGDMGSGWSLEDLSGTASGGSEASIVDLIEELAQDPLNDDFAAPVFVNGDETLIVTA